LELINESMPEDLMVYFEFDKVIFKTDPQTDISIAELMSWIEKNPSSVISVTGHTDSVGTSEYNQNLGLRRAQRIQKYLEEKGISSTKVITDSKGENQPVSDSPTEEGRAMNRRAEISIKN